MTPIHALIIDDNPSNIEVLSMLLTQQSINYTALTSPRNLAEVLNEIAPVDVVFLDLEIPNYNGFELLNDLKGHSTTVNARIVAYTVHISEIDEARQAGFDSFLGKPLDLQRFPEQLDRILRREPVWEVGQ